MVHALNEIYRVLKPEGVLIDMRPVEDHWAVEVATASDSKLAGYLTDMPVGVADDAAAFHAMGEAESQGLFKRRGEEYFSFFYYWDTPSEMKDFMEEEWEDFEKLDAEVYEKAKSLWASANADARPRVRVKMLITRWTRLDGK
jgi:SAM-dependent methyltransferase